MSVKLKLKTSTPPQWRYQCSWLERRPTEEIVFCTLMHKVYNTITFSCATSRTKKLRVQCFFNLSGKKTFNSLCNFEGSVISHQIYADRIYSHFPTTRILWNEVHLNWNSIYEYIYVCRGLRMTGVWYMLCSLLVISMHDYALDGVAVNILTHTYSDTQTHFGNTHLYFQFNYPWGSFFV